MLGDSEVVLTGGAENLSQAPHVLRGIRFGIRNSHYETCKNGGTQSVWSCVFSIL